MDQGTEQRAQIAETLPSELTLTARLGGPLALGELGWMSTYIVDALMIGRLPHSALSISASSLGNTIFYTIVFCVIRLLTGVNTLVAQAFGRGDQESCTRNLVQSFWLVLLGTPLVIFLTLAFLPLLAHFGTPADIRAETSTYLQALVWSTAPLLLYMALRQYLQSLNRVVLIMVSLITASLINFVGDWAFLFWSPRASADGHCRLGVVHLPGALVHAGDCLGCGCSNPENSTAKESPGHCSLPICGS